MSRAIKAKPQRFITSSIPPVGCNQRMSYFIAKRRRALIFHTKGTKISPCLLWGATVAEEVLDCGKVLPEPFTKDP